MKPNWESQVRFTESVVGGVVGGLKERGNELAGRGGRARRSDQERN